MAKPNFPGLMLGPLPVARINLTLGLTLPPGTVTMSKAAHHHIATKHGDEYAAVMAMLNTLIANPAMVGRDPAHPHGFYLVDALPPPSTRFGLVAIGFTLTPGGTYPISSAYGLKAGQVTGRIKAGRLFPLAALP